MPDTDEKLSVEDVKKLKGFENLHIVHGATYKDCSTVMVVPTRGQPWDKTMSPKFFAYLKRLLAPMNQAREDYFACGHEVGKAYDAAIADILKGPFKHYKYILTVEDDNLPPLDGHIRLLESLDETGWDVMGGLYFTKGLVNEPMAYGDPDEFRRSGYLDFRPRDVREAVKKGQIIEVNGVAMGFTLWKMDLFREIEPPWFVTNPEVSDGEGLLSERKKIAWTQDLDFCRKLKRIGAKRLGIDTRVRVGHFDSVSEECY